MSRFTRALVLALSLTAASSPALACQMFNPTVLADIKYADVVVVGRVANYHMVLDQKARHQRAKLLAAHPELHKIFGDQKDWLTDYARFDLQVTEVLKGKAPRTIPVTWDNSTFGEPEKMAPGPYVVALRNPRSPSPPLRGPSATIMPSAEPDVMTLLQAPCSGAFMFEVGSADEKAVRKMLRPAPKR